MAHNKKLRLLCLHGMGQNALLFSKKSAALFRGTEDWIEKGKGIRERGVHAHMACIVYVNGPHAVLDPEYASIGERHVQAEQGVSDGKTTITRP